MPFDGSNYETNPADYSGTVTNPVTELLEQAWSLIDRPQKWCRGQPESIDGRRQCSLAALNTAAFQAGGRPGDYCHILALAVLARATTDMPGPAMPSNIASFNDRHSHAEVAAAWQRAIAMSRTIT